MMYTVLFVVLMLCISSAASASRVMQFTECNPSNPDYKQYDSGSALIQLNPNNIGGTINWNFCAWTPTPLIHVKKIRIDLADDGINIASHELSICNENGSDCVNQLRTNTNPSCLTGKKVLPWLRFPNQNVTGTIALLEPGYNHNMVAKFCS